MACNFKTEQPALPRIPPNRTRRGHVKIDANDPEESNSRRASALSHPSERACVLRRAIIGDRHFRGWRPRQCAIRICNRTQSLRLSGPSIRMIATASRIVVTPALLYPCCRSRQSSSLAVQKSFALLLDPKPPLGGALWQIMADCLGGPADFGSRLHNRHRGLIRSGKTGDEVMVSRHRKHAPRHLATASASYRPWFEQRRAHHAPKPLPPDSRC